jgi:hypothetical protein
MSNKYCSPKNRRNSVTCFNDDSLIKMASAYNQKHNDKITLPPKSKTKLSQNERERIWNSLKEKLRNEAPCSYDFCYIEADTIKNMKDDEITYKTFVPEKPSSWYDEPYEWLSNLDIDKVMKQYEHDGRFVFFGPTPIDFDTRLLFNRCVNQSLCDISIEDLYKKGRRQLGVIFNLDPHTKPGSHWTALFVDLNTGGIYYFDSYGIKPPNEVKNLMRRIRSQGNELILKGGLKLGGLHQNIIDGTITENKMIEVKSLRGGNGKIDTDDIIYISGGGSSAHIKVKQVKNNGSTAVIILENDIPNEIIKSKEYKIIHNDFKEFYNPTRFQYKNSECGMFSMWFIIQFLEDKKFQDIITSKIDDDTVFKKRDEYFRPNIKKISKK